VQVRLAYAVGFAGIYHAMTWPQISFVAEDHKGRIVGYVLAKMYGASSILYPSLTPVHLSHTAKKSRRKTTKKKSSMGMSTQYLCYVRIDVWALQRN
jgi:hypothetical protein